MSPFKYLEVISFDNSMMGICFVEFLLINFTSSNLIVDVNSEGKSNGEYRVC